MNSQSLYNTVSLAIEVQYMRLKIPKLTGNNTSEISSTARTLASVYKFFLHFSRLSHLFSTLLSAEGSLIISSCSIFANSTISSCGLQILSCLYLCVMNKKKQEWQLREVVNDGNERLSFKYVGFYNLYDIANVPFPHFKQEFAQAQWIMPNN